MPDPAGVPVIGITEGTYMVGKDIKPGRYRSNGSDTCYWARLKGVSGETDDIIANSISPGPQVVVIKRSDVAFMTSGCGRWFKAK
jgi:hypothetical protein